MELIIWTNLGRTLMFKNVSNFNYHTQGFEFGYVGVSTGKKRRANFNNTSVSGYAMTESDGEELIYDQEDAIKFIKKDICELQLNDSIIRAVLNSEEDYMRSVDIIKE